MSCEIVFLHNFYSIFDFYVVLQPSSVRTLSSLGPGAELLPQATEIDAEKVLKIDAKRFQNEAKMDAEINDF